MKFLNEILDFFKNLTIENAVDKALAEGWRTADLWHEGFKKANTEDMTKAVIANI